MLGSIINGSDDGGLGAKQVYVFDHVGYGYVIVRAENLQHWRTAQPWEQCF